jgi:hypothetical protein
VESPLDIMKVAGAEPINNEGSPWAMDTIDFAAPAADPLDHECNRIKCSLALKLVNQSALYNWIDVANCHHKSADASRSPR